MQNDNQLATDIGRRLSEIAREVAVLAEAIGEIERRQQEREQAVGNVLSQIAALSGQLAEIGPTASLVQLREWTDQMAELQAELAEAQEAWLRQQRKRLHASSA